MTDRFCITKNINSSNDYFTCFGGSYEYYWNQQFCDVGLYTLCVTEMMGSTCEQTLMKKQNKSKNKNNHKSKYKPQLNYSMPP